MQNHQFTGTSFICVAMPVRWNLMNFFTIFGVKISQSLRYKTVRRSRGKVSPLAMFIDDRSGIIIPEYYQQQLRFLRKDLCNLISANSPFVEPTSHLLLPSHFFTTITKHSLIFLTLSF